MALLAVLQWNFGEYSTFIHVLHKIKKPPKPLKLKMTCKTNFEEVRAGRSSKGMGPPRSTLISLILNEVDMLPHTPLQIANAAQEKRTGPTNLLRSRPPGQLAHLSLSRALTMNASVSILP